MSIFERTGPMALSSRLRLFTAQLTEEAQKVFDAYHIGLSPNWFLVFYVLADGSEKTITQIANEIGHSQPSVTKIVKEMKNTGLVATHLKSNDKRTNFVGLSKVGLDLTEEIKPLLDDLNKAIANIQKEANHNLWETLNEWEFLFSQKPLLKRVIEEKKLRESKDVKIVNYQHKYQEAFQKLNEEWISKFFVMEEADHKALDKPEEYILDKGGKILVALYKDEPVGVCALIKMNDPDYDYELAKMAVSPKAQGKSIGWLLGEAIKKTAKELGASKIYLESNTSLAPAINLYYKLGFQKITGRPTPYQRANIQMELNLK